MLRGPKVEKGIRKRKIKDERDKRRRKGNVARMKDGKE